jgi:Protein of unknown function (DUF2384)
MQDGYMGSVIPLRSECFCGSGKEYRACCFLLKKLPNGASIKLKVRYWRKLLLEGLVSLEKFTTTTICDIGEIYQFAEEYFFGEQLVDELDRLRHLLALLALTRLDLRDFTPEDFRDDSEEEETDSLFTSAYFFLAGQDQKFLKSDRGRAFWQTIRTPITFYQVVAVNPKESVVVKDLLLCRETVVFDHVLSLSVTQGEILLGQVCSFDDISVFGVMGGYSLNPAALAQILPLRESFVNELKDEEKDLDDNTLWIFESEVVDLYTSYLSTTLNEEPSTICNSEGDLLQFFQISGPVRLSVDEITQRLVEYIDPESLKIRSEDPLSVAFSLLLTAEEDSTQERTLLGVATIEHGTMKVEVNSERRASTVKEMLLSRLDMPMQDVKVEQIKSKSFSFVGGGSIEDELFLKSLEGRQFISEVLKDFRESWFSRPIPALDSMTPLEAAKTEQGRELLESLFSHYDDRNEKLRQDKSEIFTMDVEFFRHRLGLGNSQ